MKKFSKNLCVVTSLVAMLGSIVMPVYASDTVIGEAISNQSNVVSESAILPEDFGEIYQSSLLVLVVRQSR